MSFNDFLNADPSEEQKQAKKKKAEPVKERILSEDEQKKREDNKRRLEEMRKKREMDAKRREEATKAEEERKAEQERLLEEMKGAKAGGSKPKQRKNKMFR